VAGCTLPLPYATLLGMRCQAVLLGLLVYVINVFLPLPAKATLSEVEVGRKFSLVALAGLPLIRDDTVQQYVQKLGQRIVSGLQEPAFTYRFFVVQDRQLNAFSVPGGYIYIHSGLLLKVANSDELASVLGHEVAHIQNHHIVRQQEDTSLLSMGSLAAMVLSVINPGLGLGVAAAGQAKMMKYARALEEESDYRGLQYMKQAGFDPRGMPSFFKKMWQEERMNPSYVPPYFRSHPLSQDRLSYIERTLKTFNWELPEARGRDFELERVQAILRTARESRSRMVAEYERRVEADPENPYPLALLGTVFLHHRDFTRARELLEKADRQGIDVLPELGLTYWYLGEPALARRTFARKIEIDPQDAGARTQLAKILFQENEIDRAREECQQALALDPFQSEAHYTLALIYTLAGDQAKQRYHLGMAYTLQGRPDKALKQFEQAAPLLEEDSAEAQELRQKVADLTEILGSLRRQRMR